MISLKDQEKLDRLSSLQWELSFERMLLPLMFIACAVVFGIKFLFTGTYDAGWLFGGIMPVLGLILLIMNFKDRKRYKEEVKELKMELGL